MKAKLIITLIIVLVLGAVTSAQEATPEADQRGARGEVLHEIAQIVSDATGLTPQEIREELQSGKTLAQVIEENGGDVQAVIDQSVTVITEHVNQAVAEGRVTQEQADRVLGNLEQHITDIVNGEFRPRGGRRGGEGTPNFGEILQIIETQTGLAPQEIRDELQSGKTLAQIIEENGGDAQVAINETVAALTERINQAAAEGRITQEQADQIIGVLVGVVTDVFNSETPNFHEMLPNLGEGGRRGEAGQPNPRHQIVQAAADATGLTVQQFVEQVQGGKTPAQVLSENGIDVDTFVEEQLQPVEERLNEAVASGQISQAVADARLNLRRVELLDALNRLPEPPQQ